MNEHDHDPLTRLLIFCLSDPGQIAKIPAQFILKAGSYGRGAKRITSHQHVFCPSHEHALHLLQSHLRWFLPLSALILSSLRLQRAGISVTNILPRERIERSILLLRGHKVMLDADLAVLYGVSTKRLNEQVRRNRSRFPDDFMFQLTREEVRSLRSQFATSKQGRGGRRYAPLVFTEQGIAMLSTVLNSERAIQVNIEIMRAFVRLREMIATHKDLARKLEALEKRYDAQFRVVFDAIRELMKPPESKKRKIGFLVKERAARYGRG